MNLTPENQIKHKKRGGSKKKKASQTTFNALKTQLIAEGMNRYSQMIRDRKHKNLLEMEAQIIKIQMREQKPLTRDEALNMLLEANWGSKTKEYPNDTKGPSSEDINHQTMDIDHPDPYNFTSTPPKTIKMSPTLRRLKPTPSDIPKSARSTTFDDVEDFDDDQGGE